jgi:hypothetical protein
VHTYCLKLAEFQGAKLQSGLANLYIVSENVLALREIESGLFADRHDAACRISCEEEGHRPQLTCL